MAPKMKVETNQSSSTKAAAKPAAKVSKSTPPKMTVETPERSDKATTPAKAAPAKVTSSGKTKVAAAKASAPKPMVSARVIYDEEPASGSADGASARDGRASADETPKAGGPAGAFASVSQWVHTTFPGHEHAFWGGVVAFVVALLTFVIGPARMLLVCLLVVAGVAVGQILDGDPKIVRMVRGLFDNDLEQR